jgi:hypothetical protein
MTSAPRVFITQENQNQNYVAAEQFGTVVFLTRFEVSPIKNSIRNRDLVANLRSQLNDFNPEVDYLAPSGSPIVTGIAFAILAERHRAWTALRWSNRDQLYQPIPVNLN